jgi:hypothetical protein
VAPQVVLLTLNPAETAGVPSWMATVPLLMSETGVAAEFWPVATAPKATEEGVSVSALGAPMAVPLRGAVTWTPETFMAGRVSRPGRLPVAIGAKETAITQFALGASVEAQVSLAIR